MARPTKYTVDYFPHNVRHGKTMFILESKWGNDGYAVWFKLLERLGDSDYHFIDCRDYATYAHLAAYCRVSEETLTDILNELSAVNAIHQGLWRKKLIYSCHFVENVADAYRKRPQNTASVEAVCRAAKVVIDGVNNDTREFLPEETPASGSNPPEETGKGKGKGKGKEKKVIKENYSDDFLKLWAAYPKKSGSKKAAFAEWKKLNGTKPSPEIVLEAINKQIEWRNKAGPDDFRPEWKDLERWIKNRMWEIEIEPPKQKSVFS